MEKEKRGNGQRKETMKVEMILLGQAVIIEVTKKKMASMRLRIMPAGGLKMSVPVGVTVAQIKQFVEKNKEKIEKRLSEIRAQPQKIPISEIADGVHISVLGEEYAVKILCAKENRIHLEKGLCVVETRRPLDEKYVTARFCEWFKSEALREFTLIARSLYPAVAEYGVGFPAISVKKMTSRWGSCCYEKGKISLSYYLFRARREAVEYVVLHELVHFLYHGHNREFYDFVQSVMPDWKIRKQALGEVSLSGI
ncbi:MAG: SprT family zinc-dependent metalloprotease [Oscillospiraceae bacterium]